MDSYEAPVSHAKDVFMLKRLKVRLRERASLYVRRFVVPTPFGSYYGACNSAVLRCLVQYARVFLRLVP